MTKYLVMSGGFGAPIRAAALDSIFLAEIAWYERFLAMVKFPTWGFREREAESARKIVHTVQSLPATLGASGVEGAHLLGYGGEVVRRGAIAREELLALIDATEDGR